MFVFTILKEIKKSFWRFSIKKNYLTSFVVNLSQKRTTMQLFLRTFLLFSMVNVFSQSINTIKPVVKIDSLYREDQFYLGISINTLQSKPSGLTQNKIAPGFSAGFLRDFPLNKKRNIAIAPGLGFSFSKYSQNLAITGTNDLPIYTIIESKSEYSKNKFSRLLVEVPLEFRWRTSTYESTKFWRIYTGFKVGYLLYNQSVYEDSTGKTVLTNNNDFNKIQYGTYIAAGYNTFNFYIYYGLNPIFKSAQTISEKLDMNSINFGLLFYIL